ncbi:MAG: hypothetical protein ACI8Z1_003632 [Candidatus Azotimanducaceae bacterium]|jgi:hypothetical protein
MTTARTNSVKHLDRRALAPVVRTALAASISLAIGTAEASSRLRLALDDVITSHAESEVILIDGRVKVAALIQSHPDPMLAELERRYRALPPLEYAAEEIPERYIAGPTRSEEVFGSIKNIAGDVAQFVPTISTSIQHDDISEQGLTFDDDGNPTRRHYSAALTTVNPTFLFETEQRKWKASAKYDYVHGRYFIDRSADVNNHKIDANWTLRLDRGDELKVSALIEDTHDRKTEDPILDFNSSLESQDLKYNRALMDVRYKNGSDEDRSRYEISAFKEEADLNATELFGGGYKLDRVGIGGRYAWRLRRQLSLIAEARYHDFDYNLALRDNNQFRALLGAEFVFGRRLRANVRLGVEEKRFDQSEADDSFSETVWRGLVEWALRRRTSIKIETGRDIYELATVDRPIDVDKFNVQQWIKTEWQEKWTEQFSTAASYSIRDTEFKGRNNSELAQQFVLSGTYKATNRLKVSLDGAYTRRESDLDQDFSRRTFTLRTKYSL